jgi:predicted transposase YbfD/YdcC
MKTLIEHFEIIEDPRDPRGKRHELINILVMTVYGVLCGFTDFVNMADFLELKEEYFVKLLNLEYGIPSHDCFSRVFAVIDAKKFMEIFIEWIKEAVSEKGRFLSIDGKAIKSATDKVNGGNTPYIVSAFLSEIGISVGQLKVEDKSNEITAIPDLLDLIDVKGMIVTIDAIGTQENIANKIVEKNGNFVLKVKDNQKDLKNDIQTYFDMNKEENLNIAEYTTIPEKCHGRIEYRKYYLSFETNVISDKNKWKSVKAIGKVTTYKEERGKSTIENSYYISSKKILLQTFEEATRSHWNIETGLHWRLDVIMDEDHSTSKVGNSIENLSTIRKIVFNLARLDNSFGEKVTLKKKITRYMLDFSNIENLIFEVIPSIS